MLHYLFIIKISLFSFVLILFPFSFVLGYNNLSGLILLQAEENGEAWYVKPENNKRIFLNRPADAFEIMKNHSLGIKSAELDYYLNNSFPSRLKGKILLDVERNGEAYYIYPQNNQAYFLNRPADAFLIMRTLSLGISNHDLNKIKILGVEDEDLSDNLENLTEFIDNLETSQQLVNYLNKYFHLQERDDYQTKTPEEFFNDKVGNEFDFLVFASWALNEKLDIVGLIRYEYLNSVNVYSKGAVVFRDSDNTPRQLSFIDHKFTISEYGNSFRALIRYKEEKLDIKVNRWAYFPVGVYDLSKPKSPFSWQT
jgi:hypothetical protein